MKRLHLLCNAHIDPVWLWKWEEGVAAAISTFRTAADLCEEYDTLIFNHNEAILYQWIETYEPDLFIRIKKLVEAGKWVIIGGWFLQPDCNLPSGESFVRQILLGRKYFLDKFSVKPRNAVNFDSFGHTRGLVQIMKKSGFDSYVITRPDQAFMQIEDNDFIWVGYDGSEIMVSRNNDSYASLLGEADKKINNYISQNEDKLEIGLLLWGVGNHGGGPSREDLNNIDKLIKEYEEKGIKVLHSTPDKYFEEKFNQKEMIKVSTSLNPFNQGCYTSQMRIKALHRELEGFLFATEKSVTHAEIVGLINYPENELNNAQYDLAYSQFHDILPGSSIPSVEKDSIRLINHGLEGLSRINTLAFFSLCKGQRKANNGEIPILIYNYHPYKIKGIFECECQLGNQNWADSYTNLLVYQNGKYIPSQVEKEEGNLALDWRKRVVFTAELEASSINRFDCVSKIVPLKPVISSKPINGYFEFNNGNLSISINAKTGLVDKYEIDGVSYLEKGAFCPIIMKDTSDSWGTGLNKLTEVIGKFTLMDEEDGRAFSGSDCIEYSGARIVEKGDARTIVEALMNCGQSKILMQYLIPHHGSELEVRIKVLWVERDSMLKLSMPTKLSGRCIGEQAFGAEDMPQNGDEWIAQKWLCVVSEDEKIGFSCINNCTYGCSYEGGELRISMLRSSAYSAQWCDCKYPFLNENRYYDRFDNGVHDFTFWFIGGGFTNVITNVGRLSQVKNEKPIAVSFFPSGIGEIPIHGIVLNGDSSVILSAFKRAYSDHGYIVRLFESSGNRASCELNIPAANISKKVDLIPYEVKTYKFFIDGTIFEYSIDETSDEVEVLK